MFHDQFFIRCLAFLLLVAPAHAYAQVSTVQALNFGNWISRNNNAQYDIIINTDGSYSFDASGFFLISAPVEGVYDIQTAQINTVITSVVVTEASRLNGAPGFFDLVNLQETHIATTNGLGIARVTIGGTARTSGNTQPYQDQAYAGSIDIDINF